MSKIDKRFYKALKFLSSYSVLDILNMLTDNKKRFRKYVQRDMDRTLQRDGYMAFQPGATSVLTMKGLQFLRDLKEIRRKDLTLIGFVVVIGVSLVALVISIISLVNSV